MNFFLKKWFRASSCLMSRCRISVRTADRYSRQKKKNGPVRKSSPPVVGDGVCCCPPPGHGVHPGPLQYRELHLLQPSRRPGAGSAAPLCAPPLLPTLQPTFFQGGAAAGPQVQPLPPRVPAGLGPAGAPAGRTTSPESGGWDWSSGSTAFPPPPTLRSQDGCVDHLDFVLDCAVPVRPRRQIIYPLKELGPNAPARSITEEQVGYHTLQRQEPFRGGRVCLLGMKIAHSNKVFLTTRD